MGEPSLSASSSKSSGEHPHSSSTSVIHRHIYHLSWIIHCPISCFWDWVSAVWSTEKEQQCCRWDCCLCDRMYTAQWSSVIYHLSSAVTHMLSWFICLSRVGEEWTKSCMWSYVWCEHIHACTSCINTCKDMDTAIRSKTHTKQGQYCSSPDLSHSTIHSGQARLDPILLCILSGQIIITLIWPQLNELP